MTETETATRKEWIVFFLIIAFVVFLAVAVIIILRGPFGRSPQNPIPFYHQLVTGLT
jgi:nitrate reductase NapE component